MVQLEESVCSETERICWYMMTTGSSAVLNPPGTVHRAAAGVGAQHSEEPCSACATGDVHTGV